MFGILFMFVTLAPHPLFPSHRTNFPYPHINIRFPCLLWLQKLLALPTQYTTPAQRTLWTSMLAIQPPLPKSANGTILLPAAVVAGGLQNSETPGALLVLD